MHSDLLETRLIGERMRRMPQEHSPPISWEQLRLTMAAPKVARVIEDEAAQVLRPGRWRHAALAAGLLALVAGLATWGRFASPEGAEGLRISSAEIDPPSLVMPDKQAFAQAAASERWLSRLPIEPAVMRVGTRTAVADLEDRIAWMDDTLSAERLDAIDQPHIIALQRERARLINSLAQVRYAETLVAAAQ